MNFNRLVHQLTRLRIFTYLYANGETSFSTLQDDLAVTEGNLSNHLHKIETAGCIVVEKTFVDRKPRTTYQLTDKGRETFEEHIGMLEDLIHDLDGPWNEYLASDRSDSSSFGVGEQPEGG